MTRKTVLGIVMVLAVIAEFALAGYIHHYYDRWYHHIPGFFAAYGFAGCASIVLISKLLGKIWLQKPEEYYEGAAQDD